MSAENEMSEAKKKLAHLGGLAEKYAPCFRERYDFSSEDNYNQIAEQAWKLAVAVAKKQEAELAKLKGAANG